MSTAVHRHWNILEDDHVAIDLYRIALSPRSASERTRALTGLQKKLSSIERDSIAVVGKKLGSEIEPEASLAKSLGQNFTQIHEDRSFFEGVRRRFAGKGGVPLVSAEMVALEIWLDLSDGNRPGVQTPSGILERVSHIHREMEI